MSARPALSYLLLPRNLLSFSHRSESISRSDKNKNRKNHKKLTDEEKAKIAEEAARKAERASRQGGGLNPLAVLLLLLAISMGE